MAGHSEPNKETIFLVFGGDRTGNLPGFSTCCVLFFLSAHFYMLRYLHQIECASRDRTCKLRSPIKEVVWNWIVTTMADLFSQLVRWTLVIWKGVGLIRLSLEGVYCFIPLEYCCKRTFLRSNLG